MESDHSVIRFDYCMTVRFWPKAAAGVVSGECPLLPNTRHSAVALMLRRGGVGRIELILAEFWSPSLTKKFSEGLFHDPVKTQGT